MKKILAIEDDPVMLKILQSSFLRRQDTELLVAIDPEEGLRKVEEEKPDLVLLDIMLPGRSGLEILAKLKQNPNTRRVPVVILSIIGREDVRTQALKLGAAAYIVKGITPLSEMVEKVNAVLERQNL